MSWKPIEKLVSDDPIWVLKYYMYSKDGNFVPADTEGALKLCSIHGYYFNEDDARKVWSHFPNPQGYTIEKVYKRVLLAEPICDSNWSVKR